MLKALRKKGFRICLDDFRVASSSLSAFEKMPFDEIKIHASALRRAQKDRIALTVLAAVTGLAHNLGMSVCAEGVEDRETFEFLKTIECDKMQGFLISEAVIPRHHPPRLLRKRPNPRRRSRLARSPQRGQSPFLERALTPLGGARKGAATCLAEVFQDAVEFIEAVVPDDDLASAIGGVIHADFRAQLLRYLDFEASNICVLGQCFFRRLGCLSTLETPDEFLGVSN